MRVDVGGRKAEGGCRQPDWHPTAPIANLRKRAEILATIRAFFARRDVLEVETPLLSKAAVTDVHLDSIAADGGFLQTSPEFAMKRLLAAGAGDIYQLCKVFRAGEAGRHHNPEFTLLEWYRVGWDYHRLMAEVADLLAQVLGIETEPEYLSYREAFVRRLELDPFTAPPDALEAAAERAGLGGAGPLDRDGWLDLLAGGCVYPALGKDRLCFIYDFPVSQAALARVRQDEPPVAERFEVLFDGLELGNGFTELTDADEQRRRFEHDLAYRRKQGLAEPPIDRRFLAALEAGLPESAGVAVGVDRVVMLACRGERIGDVTAFTAENA
ncbi:MAG TPA: EF-P lysine aminoacylase EpmA [Gammaproteobacteria bacterium]|nr:EF-P lysine aminoacylase EpmA [Gammaproteobacteria bacterium]